VLSDGAGVNSGLNVLSATDTALADPRKRTAIQDFASRGDKGYTWSKDNPGAFDKWYARFAHQPVEVAAQVRPEETAYQRIPGRRRARRPVAKDLRHMGPAGLVPRRQGLGQVHRLGDRSAVTRAVVVRSATHPASSRPCAPRRPHLHRRTDAG
jgi:hypothetical protein